MKTVNQAWLTEQKLKLDRCISQNIHYEIVLSFNPAKQAIITAIAEKGLPFAIYQLGAGVSRITTNTSQCPYCGRAIK